MKQFLKENAIVIYAACMFIALGIILFDLNRVNRLRNQKQNVESKVGKYIVLNNDSLMIIYCNTQDGTYTLSNGAKLSISLVK